MSKLVTLEQAKKLKELGYREKVTAYYLDGSIDFNSPINWNTNEGLSEDDESQDDDGYYSAPSTSEALEWFREARGTPCNVSLDVFEDEYRPLIYKYTGLYWEGYSVFDTDSFDTHPEAESALLDALIKYEVKRIEFNNNRTEIDE